MARKIMALALAMLMIFSVVSYGAYFSDLQDGSYSWAEETINRLADEGVIKGYSDGTYGPAKQITRQEALTLFARAAGVNDAENAYGVEFNQYSFKTVADNYNTYAKKELCFLLERGILTEDEIDFYLAEDNKNQVMLRHEAAVLISAILGVREDFDKTGEYPVEFADIEEIPESSLAAVGYAAQEGVLSGMEDGSFAPNDGVTRAQVAIMLDRVIKKLGINYITGTITQVSEDNSNLLSVDGEEYILDSKTRYAVNGRICDYEDMQVGDSVVVIYVSTGVWAVEVIRASELIFENIRGKVKDISSTSLTLENGDTYGVSAFLACFEEGESIKYSDMNFDNPVKLEIVNGFVRRIEGMGDKCEYDDVKILGITTLPSKKLKIEIAEDETAEFEIADDAEITRNGYEIELKELSTKDLAYVFVDAGIVTKIGSYPDLEGNGVIVRQLVIDENESSILLKIGAGERFKLEDTTVYLNESGEKGEVYDLRVGGAVEAQFKEGKIALLKHGKYIPPTHFSGTVIEVDKENKIIIMETADGEERKVTVSDKTSMFNYAEVKKLELKNIEENYYLIIDGYYEGEEFIASSIIM